MARQHHRAARSPAGAGCPAPPPRSPGPDARSARPAAAAARSSGTPGRSPRAAPGRRTGRSRPRPPACPAPPAAPRRTRRRGRCARPPPPRRRVASGRANRMLSRIDAGEQHRALADPGGQPGQRLRHQVGDVGAVDRHPAAVRAHEAEQDLDAGRLARRRRARPAPASRRRATRKVSPSSAGPRDGSQVSRTSSNATRHAAARRRCGPGTRRRGRRRGRQVDQRLGGAGGVQPVLVGGGEGRAAARRTPAPAAARTAPGRAAARRPASSARP